jgi:hypothetical protein
MSEFLTKAFSVLPLVGTNPLALVALITIVGAATFLFWQQRVLTSLADTVRALPEGDRLKHIRLHYGAQPRAGIAAADWLSSRKQSFLFWAYVSTIVSVLLAFIVIYGRAVRELPGGLKHEELVASFSKLHVRLSQYKLAARDLKDAFALAGANAIEPGPAEDANLTAAVVAYNKAYTDIHDNEQSYVQPIVRHLEDSPELKERVIELLGYVLRDVHSNGPLRFNDIAYKRYQKVQSLRKSFPNGSPESQEKIDKEKVEGGIELQAHAEVVEKQLNALEHKIDSLSKAITGD